MTREGILELQNRRKILYVDAEDLLKYFKVCISLGKNEIIKKSKYTSMNWNFNKF
jgi:hypothetical protein